MIGARVHSKSSCMIDATGTLRDLTTNGEIGVDTHTLILDPYPDGWARPRDPGSLSSMPNVPVCPPLTGNTSVDGNPFQAELTLQDASGATVATLDATVTPMCPTGDGFCHLECQPESN